MVNALFRDGEVNDESRLPLKAHSSLSWLSSLTGPPSGGPFLYGRWSGGWAGLRGAAPSAITGRAEDDADLNQAADDKGLVHDWRFVPSRVEGWFSRERIRDFLFRLRPAPPTRIIRAATQQNRWILYFAFLPDGQLTPAHRFTLEKLRCAQASLLVVCATPDAGDVPAELHDIADALIWKGMSGFDFSAFAAGLRHIAAASPGADVFVINDSVLGPFADLDAMFDRARFDLTGMTGSRLEENHVQSYAFILRKVTPARLRGLWTIFPPGRAFDDFAAVVRSQETRFARVAARHMSVGAFWFADDPDNRDPTLFTPDVLLDQGFPFIKKSALAKFRHVVGEAMVATLDARLAAFGHPPFP